MKFLVEVVSSAVNEYEDPLSDYALVDVDDADVRSMREQLVFAQKEDERIISIRYQGFARFADNTDAYPYTDLNESQQEHIDERGYVLLLMPEQAAIASAVENGGVDTEMDAMEVLPIGFRFSAQGAHSDEYLETRVIPWEAVQ